MVMGEVIIVGFESLKEDCLEREGGDRMRRSSSSPTVSRLPLPPTVAVVGVLGVLVLHKLSAKCRGEGEFVEKCYNAQQLNSR